MHNYTLEVSLVSNVKNGFKIAKKELKWSLFHEMKKNDILTFYGALQPEPDLLQQTAADQTHFSIDCSQDGRAVFRGWGTVTEALLNY